MLTYAAAQAIAVVDSIAYKDRYVGLTGTEALELQAKEKKEVRAHTRARARAYTHTHAHAHKHTTPSFDTHTQPHLLQVFIKCVCVCGSVNRSVCVCSVVRKKQTCVLCVCGVKQV
jgi:hypothetical protein